MANATASQVLKELKKQVSHNELLDLVKVEERQHPKWPNIVVSYISFLSWLKMYDPNMYDPKTLAAAARGNDPKIRGWKVNIGSYRFQREDYLGKVIDQLSEIWRWRTGKALQVEIGASKGGQITIFPYEKLKVSSDQHFSSKVISDPNRSCPACGYRKRMPVLDHEGEPRKDVGVGTGAGNGAWIGYSPRMWGKEGTSGKREVWFNPDAVLFHELVHASRLMRGVFNMIAVDLFYGNVEEYLAVVVSNIYLSEKRTQVLRGGHQDGSPVLLPKDQKAFLNNPQKVTPSPRWLLGSFSVWQQDFFDALTRIGPMLPTFNPVRELRAEAYR